MNSRQTQAIGHFLAYYENDLNHMRYFKKKIGDGQKIELKEDGTFEEEFQQFLVDLRLARTLKKSISLGKDYSQRKDLIITIENFDFSNGSPSAVDMFCEQSKYLKGHLSLASKIMSFIHPSKLYPFDSQVSEKVGVSKNKGYEEYFKELESKLKGLKSEIDELDIFVRDAVADIEKEFENDFKDIDKIRRKRIEDKFMWVLDDD